MCNKNSDFPTYNELGELSTFNLHSNNQKNTCATHLDWCWQGPLEVSASALPPTPNPGLQEYKSDS